MCQHPHHAWPLWPNCQCPWLLAVCYCASSCFVHGGQMAASSQPTPDAVPHLLRHLLCLSAPRPLEPLCSDKRILESRILGTCSFHIWQTLRRYVCLSHGVERTCPNQPLLRVEISLATWPPLSHLNPSLDGVAVVLSKISITCFNNLWG